MEIINAPYDRDAVISDLTDLQELLGASLEAFGEVKFGCGDTRNHHLERIFSFTRLAFEWTQGIERKLSSPKGNAI
ncbi:hypothetical protein JJB09_18495 [Rhizobium sp. KVB221]|uniref:Uncharacterized protein n=1 Tax=Rhizobium setariae TaxID=2801340 RepID=A0A936YTC7_9HYPH|nr:hypothetical protein [Rhizobium setariae]MBL0374014.1 hypothetical protein [Rhizobium setariae]